MDVNFYLNFEKRKNSTKQPPEDDSYTAHGHLKSPMSIMNPVIEFQAGEIRGVFLAVAPDRLNYCYIRSFERYYFVTDWTFDEGLWIATMEVDVLATNKLPISALTAYVERASGVNAGSPLPFWNGKIIDTYYPTLHKYAYTQSILEPPWTGVAYTDGCYVVGIVTRNAVLSAGGMVSYWALTANEMRQLANYLMSDTFFDDAGFPSIMTVTQQMSHEVARGLINPIQYLTSCMWFPCDTIEFTPNVASPISIGPWTIPAGSNPPVGRYINGYVGYSQTYDFTLPPHPQAQDRGEYLNYAPFTRYTAFLPPFGSFPIDLADIPPNATVTAYMAVDGITGKATLQLLTHIPNFQEAFVFFQTSSMIGIPMQLTQITSDMMGSIQSVLSAGANTIGAIGSFLTGNFAGAASAGMAAVSNVGNAIADAMPQVQTQGLPGSFLASRDFDYTLPRLTARYTYLAEEDLAERGRPLCEKRVIGQLRGFIKCIDVDMMLGCALEPEKDKMIQFMKTGFFYE